jgi:hypothetical protein
MTPFVEGLSYTTEEIKQLLFIKNEDDVNAINTIKKFFDGEFIGPLAVMPHDDWPVFETPVLPECTTVVLTGRKKPVPVIDAIQLSLAL